MQPTQRHLSGFSMIELVIAIFIIGVISAVAMSRMLEGDIYNASVVRDQIITLARSTQQQALGRTDVALILRTSGDTLQLQTVEAFVDENTYTELQAATIDIRSVELAGDVNVTDSCGVTSGTDAIGNTEPMVIQFNELGDLFRGGVTSNAGYPITATDAMRICVNDDPLNSVCLSTAGFAFAGDCE
jgi:prepilin-type N-terminal cleavage/methylation domain-containing protein